MGIRTVLSLMLLTSACAQKPLPRDMNEAPRRRPNSETASPIIQRVLNETGLVHGEYELIEHSARHDCRAGIVELVSSGGEANLLIGNFSVIRNLGQSEPDIRYSSNGCRYTVQKSEFSRGRLYFELETSCDSETYVQRTEMQVDSSTIRYRYIKDDTQEVVEEYSCQLELMR